MSSQTLTDEVMAAHSSTTVALIVLRTMTSYAEVIDGTYTDPDCTPAKRLELAETAEGQGWPELWRRHGLTFPALPDDVPRPSHPAPEPATHTPDAELRRDIETRAPKPPPAPPKPRQAAPVPPAHVLTPEKASEASQRPPALRPVPAPETPPTAPSAPPEPVPAPQRKPRGASTDAFGDVVMLELTCLKCGKDFTKPKTRGRHPRYCPDCVPPSRRKRRAGSGG